MNRLFAYFTRRLAGTILLVLLVLLSFDVAFAFFGQVSDIGRGQFALTHLFQGLVLSLPRRIFELSPMAALIGAMLGAGHLASQGELVAARASGVSVLRLTAWVVVAGLLVFIPATWLGEYLAPVTEQRATMIRTQALFKQVAVQDDLGIWVRDGSRYLHIGSVADNGRLQDIEIYEFIDNNRLVSASRIAAGEYQDNTWQLQGISRTQFNPERIDVVEAPQQQVSRLIDPAMVQVLAREPEYMQLGDLYRYINYLEANGVGAARYRLDFWSRVTRPLTVIVMLLLGAAFVLAMKQRQGSGWRLLIGVLAGLAFKLLNDLFAQAGLVYGLAPLMSAMLPTLFVAALTIWIVRRQSAV